MEYRGYLIENIGTFAMKEIKAVGRGSVVLSLRGNYTDFKAAMKAIDFYEDNKPTKEKQEDAKTNRTGRG